MSRKIKKSEFYNDEFIDKKIGEVSTNKYKEWPPNDQLDQVGKSVDRLDGYDKVSGTAVYAFDKTYPRMLHARIFRSPHPHARIKSINIKDALKSPGVAAIITKDDTDIKWYGGTTYLFDPHLRYQGDEIAAIAAETEDEALQAFKKIKVDYELLPFVVEAEKAMKDDAPKLYDEGNIVRGKPGKYSRGDIEKGFEEADETVEDTFLTQVAVHNPTEVHCSAVNWDGNELTIWDSTQNIWGVRRSVADALKIPENRVRIIKKYMGGGFGSKLEAGKYTVMAALLAKKTGRPVRITIDRKEMNLAVGNRPDSFQKLKAGFKKDGTLTALDHYSYGQVGAHPNSAQCSVPLKSLYKCPNVNVVEYSVFTNAGRARAFRAPGHVQGTFAFEQLIDMAAEKIGMDPVEFRLKNYTDIDQTNGLPYTSKYLKECYEKGAEAIGWNRRNKQAGSQNGHIKTGIGVASQIWWGGGTTPAYVTLKLNRDGSMRALSGTQDIGCGTYTFIAQVIAEVMQTDPQKIEVILGDTATTPYGVVSGGSLTAPSHSPAAREAAELMRQKLIDAAAASMEVEPEELEYAAGVVSMKDGSKKMNTGEIMEAMGEQLLITEGARNPNPEDYAINTFGAQFAEVEVNELTGKIRVKKIVAAHDIGRVLNWKTMENQMHGGIIQGLGLALMEGRTMDKNTGKCLTTHIHDYKLPTVMDMPEEIKTIIVSEGDPLISNTGVKGVGEPAHIPTAGAIANAVYNATGVRIKQLPMTPDRVLNALNQSGKG